MNHCRLYYNPDCSKSREALHILERHNIHPIIIKYLEYPLNLSELIKLRSFFELKDFVRSKEPIYAHLKLKLENETHLMNAMLEHPILMQRPIITYGAQAIIARSENEIEQFILKYI